MSELMTATIDQALAQRTRYLCLVTEDLYQPHNGAAVLRACEGFGVQDLYAIGNRNPFPLSPEIAAGAERFMLQHNDLDDLASLELLAAQVLPQIPAA